MGRSALICFSKCDNVTVLPCCLWAFMRIPMVKRGNGKCFFVCDSAEKYARMQGSANEMILIG